MCSRFACTFDHNELRKACSYKYGGKYHQPEWFDSGEVYTPSYNICAHESSPVLVNGSLVGSSSRRVLVPMQWGMIPSWHSGVSPKLHHRLDTTVCRAEGVSISRFCGKPFNHGRRCVIVCDGFYEWQRVSSGQNKVKQPFYVYKEQPDEVSIMDDGPWTWNAKSGWFGPSLLNIAGVFQTWLSALDELYYSFSMLTTPTPPSLSWLGPRMPAILDSVADVDAWLDSATVDASAALSLLTPVSALRWHSVSKHVNSWKNKDRLCIWPCEPETSPKPGVGKRPHQSDDDAENTSEKQSNILVVPARKKHEGE